MKKFFLALAIIFSTILSAQTGTTTAGQFKMTAPQVGTDNDSIVVWNGTDKRLKYVRLSDLNVVKTVNGILPGVPGGPITNVNLSLANVLNYSGRDSNFSPWTGTTSLNLDCTYKNQLLLFSNETMDGNITLTVMNPDPTGGVCYQGMQYKIVNTSDYVVTLAADSGVTLDTSLLTIPKNSIATITWIEDVFNSLNVDHFSVTYEFGNTPASGSSGTVTSVTATSPLTGGTITSTGSIGIQDAAADNTTKGAATYFPADFNSSAGAISIDYVNTQKASASQPGALSSSDWSLFNGKQNAISLTTTGTGAATFVGNTLNIPTPDLSSINTILDGLRTPIATDQGNRTHTGTIAETIVASLRIPANTLNSVCNLFINYDFQKSTGVLIPIKVYRNSTNAIGGSPIALYNTGSNRNVTFSRKFLVRNTTLDLLSTSTASLVTNMNNDNSFVSSETTSIDRTVDNWIVITATLDNTASNVVTKSMTIEKQKL